MNKFLPVLCLSLFLSACQKEGVPPPARDQQASVQQVAPQVQDATTGDNGLKIEPAALPACDPAVEATVTWNVAGKTDSKTVEIWVGNGKESKLFVAGGTAGEAKTGPWTRPGSTFQVRMPGRPDVLAETVIHGPVCHS